MSVSQYQPFGFTSNDRQQDTATSSVAPQSNRRRTAKGASKKASSKPQWTKLDTPSAAYDPPRPEGYQAAYLNITRGSIPAKTSPADWKLGEIIIFPHVLVSTDWKAPESPHKIWTPNGWICSKIRPGIIVGLYDAHMVVLPVYSSGDLGVSNRTEKEKMTMVSVWNHLQAADPKSVSLVELTRDRVEIQGDYLPKSGSHVNLLDTSLVKYDSHLSPKSTLTDDSRDLLMKLYKRVLIMTATQEPHTFPRYLEEKIEQDDKEAAQAKAALESALKSESYPELPGTSAPSLATAYAPTPVLPYPSARDTIAGAMRGLTISPTAGAKPNGTETSDRRDGQPKSKKNRGRHGMFHRGRRSDK